MIAGEEVDKISSLPSERTPGCVTLGLKSLMDLMSMPNGGSALRVGHATHRVELRRHLESLSEAELLELCRASEALQRVIERLQSVDPQ